MSDPEHANALLAYYQRYVGDPERTVDVYLGFGLFFAGLGLAMAGIGTYIYSATFPPGSMSMYTVREVAGIAGAVGLPVLLSGIVVLLPVDRRTLYVAVAGTAVCLVAIGLFAWAYPYNWNVINSTDYSAQGVAVYSVGIVLVIASTGVALVAHRVEQATAEAASDTEETAETSTVTDADVQADIDRELADAELSWGGVERAETRRLNLDTSAVDDIDRDTLSGTATEIRTESNTVDDAVGQLKGLQGGDTETASGESTDDQAAALRELRQQQQGSNEDTPSLLDRLRELF